MRRISKIAVSLQLEGTTHQVGELVLSNARIYFRYRPEFLNTGLNLSPIKLPFGGEIVRADEEPFNGLFGVFNDSLPDGWGRLLLDRTLLSRGIDLGGITPLDRLAYVGSRGMGALVYQPEIASDIPADTRLDLDGLAAEMNHILRGASSQVIEELFRLGGSSGGARPKILVAYHPQAGELIHGSDQLPEGYEEWIIKFPASSDHPEIAQIEFVYHQMALLAGLEMTECRLFRGASGQEYFGTRRFDRLQGKRLHVHTAAGLMHDNFRMSTMDYGHLMDCAFRLEQHVDAYDKIFRLAAFNVFAHNRDDHSKNFSFLMNARGHWRFAPVYDLTFSSTGYGHHSTMIAGESINPGRKNLLELAAYFGIKRAPEILDQVLEATARWDELAQSSGITPETRISIRQTLDRLRK